MTEKTPLTDQTQPPPPQKRSRLLQILLAIVGVIVILVIVVAMQPDDFQVTRSTKIKAPADKVFPHVNDFHQWEAWSPWEKLDPNIKRTYSGAPSGKGAIYGWEGDGNVGAGQMTIVESKPPELIKIKLEFFKPFAGVNDAEWTFKPEGAETTVTWTMTGKKVFITKAIGLLLSMDKMIGTNFEEGLAKLKSITEAKP